MPDPLRAAASQAASGEAGDAKVVPNVADPECQEYQKASDESAGASAGASAKHQGSGREAGDVCDNSVPSATDPKLHGSSQACGKGAGASAGASAELEDSCREAGDAGESVMPSDTNPERHDSARTHDESSGAGASAELEGSGRGPRDTNTNVMPSATDPEVCGSSHVHDESVGANAGASAEFESSGRKAGDADANLMLPAIDPQVYGNAQVCDEDAGAGAGALAEVEDSEDVGKVEWDSERASLESIRNLSLGERMRVAEAMAKRQCYKRTAEAIDRLSSVRGSHTEETWLSAANWFFDAAYLLKGKAASYLHPFGFQAASDSAWVVKPREGGVRVVLHVNNHVEGGGHTWYLVECELDATDLGDTKHIAWPSPRRLAQLRLDLHDGIKNYMYESYEAVFRDAPFAKRGAPPGTTARLRVWLETLADAINAGEAPPIVAALALKFFCVPQDGGPRASGGPTSADMQ